ncbi:hypothetical protein KVV02_006696 [Mortierella alpina]|uniref:Microtubule-associated protein n=1 Tax=Mortierella alpina TaxID=64518 RepID=A0A9P8A083_MORAP|nr:hypothetical protein KVV02_006696 [Mortierella alpina]
MTTISTSPRTTTAVPRVNLERKGTAESTRENSRVTTKAAAATASASPTTAQRPSLASSTSKRFSGIQSKVGSLEHIDYKPKASEKKIQSFKQDFSHIKSKVDAKMVLPTLSAATTDPTTVSRPRVATTRTAAVAVAAATATAGAGAGAAAAGATKGTAVSTASWNDSIKPSTTSATTRPGRISIRTAGPQSTAAVISSSSNKASSPSTPMSPPHSRRSSTSSVGMASPPVSPAGANNPRRLSRHIIPTQKAHYDHVKSKVGSLENIGYANNTALGRDRASSRASSADGENSVSKHGRSNSMSAVSSTSSTTSQTTSPGRRSSFKIPSSKKVDYTQVRSKVGSLDYIHHTPQGGNLRVFSEKLTFREQAQSKVAKEINIVQFYQNSDQAFEEGSVQDQDPEGNEQDSEQQQPQQQQQDRSSILYCSSEASHDLEEEENYEPPKNILAVLEEVTESVADLDLENPRQHGQQQANDSNHQHHRHHETRLESVAAL